MKKSLLSALAICCASCGAKDCSESRSAYEGAYIGAGLSYQHNMHDVWVSDRFRTDFEALPSGSAGVSAMEGRGYTMEDVNNRGLNRKNKGKIGGSIDVGYGKFVYSNLYLGADVNVDISGRGKTTEIDLYDRGIAGDPVSYGATTVQSNIVTPTFALRVGGYISDVDTLVCVRAGVAWVGAKAKNEFLKNEVKLSKITPIIGLGVEKNVWRNCSVKLEGDYRFPSSKKIEAKTWSFDDGSKSIETGFSEEVKVRGYSVRLMGVYHF